MKYGVLFLILSALLATGLAAPRNCQPSEEEESEKKVILYTDDAMTAREEIISIGGRVTMRLGQNIIVAKLPIDATLDLKSASTSVPHTASAEALIWLRAYEQAQEDQNGSQPEVTKWNDLTAPKALPASVTGQTRTRIETMTGKISLVILVISGPGDLALSDYDHMKVLSEVTAGSEFWTNAAPTSANLELIFRSYKVNIDVADNPSCTTQCGYGYNYCENYFVDPALQALTLETGEAGRDHIAAIVEQADGTRGTIFSHFSKYTQCYFAYAHFHGGPMFMHFSNGKYGTEKIDLVFAHELGHTVNAPDEYSSCDCSRKYGEGSCTDKNFNCKDERTGTKCSWGQKDCLMANLQLVLCEHSRHHVGWC